MPQRLCRFSVLLLALLVPSLIVAQTAPDPDAKTAKPDAAPPSLPSTATLPRNYPVITVEIPCPKTAGQSKPAAKGNCKMTVTREDFETLIKAINPKMVKGERREFAATYGRVLALSQEALKRGLDRDPRVQAQIRYSRLVALANATAREIYKDALESPSEDAEKYYATHKQLFEHYNFERLFVPLRKTGASAINPGDLEAAAKLANAAPDPEMKDLASQVYARALAGEDFAKLQQEVFQKAGVKSDPNVKLDDLRRGDLSEVQNVVFDLAPGKISELLTDQTGYFIFKLVSRQVPPFDQVRQQVTVRMQNDKSAEGISRIEKLSKAQVNQDYFDKYDPPPPDANEPDVDND